ncbi:MAG: HlyD family efflux transporter periplasmic adaptor subunit [Geothrix sp.]|uniref:HlyD family secretion protein n=1 Tax=Geothrix sp. TaxID=1962974 RepID=UPI00181A76EF|nr:HlyD family efflux transporter periplasmic adaptor subunit [Geothrix sp.]NWJ39765.1 HlyD family efflux transporter periplasmic adaptor subunit [Geothrix sp.]WIL22221.1 MAG: HlyD family efflux transporter periplasmic adaptor subunit [Geothrix sp.]
MRKFPLLLLPVSLVILAGCRRDDRPLLNGRVEGYLTDLGPRSGGRLVELTVREGQRVKAGDLLARVSAEELEAAVQRDQAGFDSADAKRLELDRGSRAEDIAQGEARVQDAGAALRLAEDSLVRARRLFGEKVMSQADLDNALASRDRADANLSLQAKALVELRAGARIEQRQAGGAEARKARAILQQSRLQAGFTEVRAPFDGVVTHRLREPGSVIAAGQPVLTLARLDQLWVRVYLPQPLLGQVRLGAPVTVMTADQRLLEASLDEISSESEFTPKMVESREERVNLVYPARVNLPQGWDKGLVPGAAVDVRLGSPSR